SRGTRLLLERDLGTRLAIRHGRILARRAVYAPEANSSTMRCASSSWYCTGGDFMKYADGPSNGPPMPRSSATFAHRTASMITPAEFGESQTSSLSSTLRGTSPKLQPTRRMYAHCRSCGHSH